MFYTTAWKAKTRLQSVA